MNIIPTEAQEQEALIEYCDYFHIPVVHIPNEGKRSYRNGANMKAQGLRRGFPDLFFPIPRGNYHGLFIELKRPDKKARVSHEQKKWIDFLNGHGYCAVVAYGQDHAMRVIKDYLSGNEIKEVYDDKKRDNKKA